jgi:hypothetical protein
LIPVSPLSAARKRIKLECDDDDDDEEFVVLFNIFPDTNPQNSCHRNRYGQGVK